MRVEVAATAPGVEHAEFAKDVLAELVDPSFPLRSWRTTEARWPTELVIDTKTGFDSPLGNSWLSNRRTATDVAMLWDTVDEDENAALVRWTPRSQQHGDELTPDFGNGVLSTVMDDGGAARAGGSRPPPAEVRLAPRRRQQVSEGQAGPPSLPGVQQG